MNKEIATKTRKNELANRPIPQAGPAPLASDLVIPYLLLSQGSSELVKERKAQIGDFVRSTTGEKFGDPDKPAEIIFLQAPQTFWRIDQQVQGTDKWRFLKTFPRHAGNETMDFRFWGDKDGEEIGKWNESKGTLKDAILHRRFKQFRVFAVMPSDIKADRLEREKAARGEFPDVSKVLTPIILSLQSTSGYPCGKDIVTFHTKCESMGFPIWRNILALTCFLEKNDDGTFYCWKLTGHNPPKPVPKEDLPAIERWVELVSRRADTFKTDERALDEAPASTVSKEKAAEVC